MQIGNNQGKSVFSGFLLKENQDILWAITLTLLSVGYCLITQKPWFESSVLITGILCVSLIAIGRKEGYLFGIYNCCAYSLTAYENGLFGELVLNLGFYLPTGILGYFMWKKKSAGKIVVMRGISQSDSVKVFVGCVLGIGVLGLILSKVAGQNTPWLDATTNILGITATFLMMWRYKEQWYFYILLNIITIVLWFFRNEAGGISADTMIFMWVLFLVNSFYGYHKWHRNSYSSLTGSKLRS